MRYPAHGLLVRQAANLISLSVIRQRAMADWALIIWPETGTCRFLKFSEAPALLLAPDCDQTL